jgi:hypothetical protein
MWSYLLILGRWPVSACLQQLCVQYNLIKYPPVSLSPRQKHALSQVTKVALLVHMHILYSTNYTRKCGCWKVRFFAKESLLFRPEKPTFSWKKVPFYCPYFLLGFDLGAKQGLRNKPGKLAENSPLVGSYHGRRNFKDTNPSMSSLLVIFVRGGEAIL